MSTVTSGSDTNTKVATNGRRIVIDIQEGQPYVEFHENGKGPFTMRDRNRVLRAIRMQYGKYIRMRRVNERVSSKGASK